MRKVEALGQIFQCVPKSSHITKYDFTWDVKNNILHVRDLGERGTFSVLHALKYSGMEFVVTLRKQFEDEFKMKLPNFDFRLFVYTSDPYVFEYDDCQLIPIDIVDFDKINVEYVKKRGKHKHVYLD